MEAIIKTSDNKSFQKIMKYLKSLGVLVYAKKKKKIQQSRDINFIGLINKLTAGFKLGAFSRDDVYDRY